MIPYASFPPDIMHLFYNFQRDLLELLMSDVFEDEFTLSNQTLQTMGEELFSFGDGVSGQIAPRPKPMAKLSSWKAADHKQFTVLYGLVLFDGQIPQKFMDVIKHFTVLAEISR